MEYSKDFRNELLKRNEVEFMLSSTSNPGFEGAKNFLVENGHSVESIVVKAVRSNFGKGEFFVEAFVYDSKENKELVEPKPKEKKAGAK